MSLGLGRLWPVAVVVGVFGLVALAFAQCAVAHVVVRISAWLYEAHPRRRAEKCEAWLADVNAMKPKERPAHAGSLLWMAVAHSPVRVRAAMRMRGDRARRAVMLVGLVRYRATGDRAEWTAARRLMRLWWLIRAPDAVALQRHLRRTGLSEEQSSEAWVFIATALLKRQVARPGDPP